MCTELRENAAAALLAGGNARFLFLLTRRGFSHSGIPSKRLGGSFLTCILLVVTVDVSVGRFKTWFFSLQSYTFRTGSALRVAIATVNLSNR